MKKYDIEIELLSDLCVSDGGSYNSSIDTDVCHDSFGFPYIPAKRLKGCFRESCLELNDWGKDIAIKEIFGDLGNKRASFTINNAYIKGYNKYLDIIRDNSNKLFFHPQNILNMYSYVRQQTSVDYEKGVAKKNSLRSIRVVKKGNVFVSEVEIDDRYVDDLKLIVSTTTNIGVNRTRGLGEVKMILKEASQSSDSKNDDASQEIDNDVDYLNYHIYLEEPVICKGFNSNSLNTLDYFEGNKVLGIIAHNVDNFIDFINQDELFVSNAYLEIDNHRMKEMPASYFTYKNNKELCFDKSQYKSNEEDIENGKQLTKMKHSYIHFDDNKKLHISSVDISNSYHHQRPEDKSIGHAVDDGNENSSSKFFQISSIDANQSFGGFITGSKDQIKKIYSILNNLECRMGFGRSSEFGKVKITVDKPIKAIENVIETDKFMVKLESPAIIYGNNASYSIDNDDLIKEVNKILKIDKNPIVYSNLITIGGFNVTWGTRKPIINAFDKGTVLIYELDSKQKIVLNPKTYIGERIQEGYGEISISELNADMFEIYKDNSVDENKEVQCDNPFVNELADMLFNQFLKSNVYYSDQHTDVKNRAVVSNMLLMLKDNIDLSTLKTTVNARYDTSVESKKDKNERANKIINHCENNLNLILRKFCSKYQLKGYNKNKNEATLNLIRNYLIRMKYEIRNSKGAQNDK